MTLQDLMMLYGVTLGKRRTAKQKYLFAQQLNESLPGLAGAGSTEGRTVFQDRKPDCRGSGKCKGRHCGPL